MKIVFGSDEVVKSISEMGVATVGEIKERVSDFMGFDESTTESRINGVVVGDGHACADTDTLSISPKANGKG